MIRKVLGHKNITTTYEHYSGAESQSALELFDTVILDIKDSKPAATGSKGKNTVEKAFLDPLNPFGKKGRR